MVLKSRVVILKDERDNNSYGDECLLIRRKALRRTFTKARGGAEAVPQDAPLFGEDTGAAPLRLKVLRRSHENEARGSEHDKCQSSFD